MSVLEQGQIQIHTENIFPIIKKAVYSGHEVFLRELVSNGTDAISKRRMAAMAGDCSEGSDGLISIKIDREAKTLTISDNGIGMNADEVKRYINKLPSPAPRNSWRNTRAKTTPSLATSAWASIPASWWPAKWSW